MFVDKAKGKLAFGAMRLPEKDGKPDIEMTKQMVDYFMANGFNYFDTARVYHQGLSEVALREALTKRYPRESYVFVNKLSNLWKKEEDIIPLFESQLEACGLEYFDIYLLHAQTAKVWPKYRDNHAYDIAFELKRQGKIRHVGFSFHDSPELLREILATYPEIECVQIQFNYLDYESEGVRARKCYEVCREFNKPILVMEPVKGGTLVKLPEEAMKALDDLHNGSPASYAIRYCASFEGIEMVLSGMSNMEQLVDNISYMKDFKPLEKREYEAIEKVVKIVNSKIVVPCTGCRYCVDGCPKRIDIPRLFDTMNQDEMFPSNWNAPFYYSILTNGRGKASDCIKCGKCEASCPQHLPIREYLQKVADKFEK